MLGIDIVEVSRLSDKNTTFLEGVFTVKELEYFASKNNSIQTLAGLFAAKEAIVKAMGTGFSGLRPKDIEILHHASGAPYTNIKGIKLSISHEKKYAVAVAIYDSSN